MPTKQALLRVMHAAGVFDALRWASRRKILILTYHRFSEHPRSEMTDVASFGEQLQYLRAHYTIVPLSAVERHLTDGAPLPCAPAVITIDDGYRDAYEIAFPILRRYGAPATLFAATDFIDGKNWLWTDKLRYIEAQLNGSAFRLDARRMNAELKRMPDEQRERRIAEISNEAGVTLPSLPPPDCQPITWSQAREMAAGGIEIGSHTVTHPILPYVDGEQLARELRQSRIRIAEMLDREVTAFCYPNGDYNAKVRDEVARAGYRVAVTAEVGLNGGSIDPFALRRIHTESDLAHFTQSTSGFEALKGRVRSIGRARSA